MIPKKLILATSNPNKAREFAALLPGIDVQPMPADFGLPEETGGTFEENARLKALAVREQYIDDAAIDDGQPPWIIADDSGIEVSALSGAPGIFSSRYAGEGATDRDNVDKLLTALALKDDRGARFVCVIVCYSPRGEEFVARGELTGTIAEEPRGGWGFGYDPVFVPDNFSLTVAELSAEEKNRISHRARAAQSLLAQFGGGK